MPGEMGDYYLPLRVIGLSFSYLNQRLAAEILTGRDAQVCLATSNANASRVRGRANVLEVG